KTPAVVTFPILLVLFSANHRLPSGPAMIPHGAARPLLEVASGYSVKEPAVVSFPILLCAVIESVSVNQRLPSGPAVIEASEKLAVGYVYLVMVTACTTAAASVTASVAAISSTLIRCVCIPRRSE